MNVHEGQTGGNPMWLVIQIACGIVLGSVIAFFIVGALSACRLSSKISQDEEKFFDNDEVESAESMEFRD